MAYMLFAFAWWSVLLFTKNQDAFKAKVELLRIGMVAEGLYKSEEQFQKTQAFKTLYDQYEWQEGMILGEAIVFVITLIIGIWFINRGYHKEAYAAQQRRNFLLSITHELKSPIASIRLITETFLRRELTKEQTAKLSRSALKETERLNTLVNDLLLSAKLETTYQLHIEELNLSVLLRELLLEMGEKHPEASFTLHEPVPVPPIQGDRPGIISMLLNLLENAVKYSPEPAVIEVNLAQSNRHIQLEVADQGIGIPEKEKKNIFEKFYRVGNEDTRNTKGTGLGLYIVQQIVKAHGGSITVHNNQLQGTIFRILLPLQQ